MIKKIILGFLFFILLLIWNLWYIKSFYFNYIWEYYFDKNDLEKSKINFEKAWSEASIYNLWNLYYKSFDYDLAIKNYESILNTTSKSLLFKVNHNLWNSYFRMWEIDSENSLDYFNMSAFFYKDALNIYFNEETKNNFEFVLLKIKELEEKKSEDDSESNSANKKTENPDKTDDSSNNSWSSDWNNKDSNNIETWLTNKQKEVIKEYQEMLKKDQNSNSDSFNKIYEWAGDYSVYENIYDNSLLENKVEKDW